MRQLPCRWSAPNRSDAGVLRDLFGMIRVAPFCFCCWSTRLRAILIETCRKSLVVSLRLATAIFSLGWGSGGICGRTLRKASRVFCTRLSTRLPIVSVFTSALSSRPPCLAVQTAGITLRTSCMWTSLSARASASQPNPTMPTTICRCVPVPSRAVTLTFGAHRRVLKTV